MHFWPFSSDDPARNLALDEALLEAIDAAESEAEGDAGSGVAGDEPLETLRVWEMASHAVVLGRSSPVASEVNAAECQRFGVPVLRRCSGGATILAGPGCLMYTAVLSLRKRPHLVSIDAAHLFAMERLTAALRVLGIEAVHEGTCDLTVGGRKVSGNAMRVKRSAVLYHGTLLYGLDIELAARLLGSPQRQPDYRGGRPHEDFLGNLAASRGELLRAVRGVFDAELDWGLFPRREAVSAAADRLLRQRYSQASWTECR